MNRSQRPQDLDLQKSATTTATATATRNRSRSSGSVDNPLSSAGSNTSLANPLVNVNPQPAYIAASAATRLVTSDHEDFFRSLRHEGVVGTGTPTMLVTSGSLSLVNQFLDFLLYSFLSNAKSTSISALRPAITEVLRIRLAKEAVSGADQELKSYLGGEDEDIGEFDDALIETNGEEWNLEATWRKCRVQCMVYSSLGDLEEDDEAFFTEAGLEGSVGLDQYECQNSNPGIVSPAVAIWLTSILEFIGEQTLLVAGHATIARYSAQRIAAANEEQSAGATFPEKPVVEELDTEKVALNPSLGRMWRQWRKKTRNGTRGSFSVPSTRDGVLQRLERQASLKSVTKSISERDTCAVDDETEENEAVSEADEVRSNTIQDGTLTPIEETTTPVLHDDSKTSDLTEGEDTEESQMRRPLSLALAAAPIPQCSSVALRNPHRRSWSLPDLKAYIDIANEREPMGQQLYTIRQSSREYDPTQLPYDPSQLADDQTTATEISDSTSTRFPIGDDSDLDESAEVEPVPNEGAKNSRNTFGRIPDPREIEEAGRAPSSHSASGEYNYNRPFFPRSISQPANSSTPDDGFKYLKGRSTSASSYHVKNASSASSGHSLSDRKIGQLQVVQGSSDRGISGTRVWTPPATPDKSRRSASFSKVQQRPIHTSGSGSSQTSILKSFVPWPNADSSKRGKSNESDAESKSSLQGSDHFSNLDDKERSFEELISSGGTIHCTLTPDPIRNMEKKYRPEPGLTPTAELADFFRSTGPDSRPITSKSMPGMGSKAAFKNTGSTGYTAPSNASNPKVHRSHNSDASARIYGGYNQSEGLPSVMRQSPIVTSPKSRLLARDATGSVGSDATSALADFFRNTVPPANGRPISSHRIPRSVAPFLDPYASGDANFIEESTVDHPLDQGHRTDRDNRSVASLPHDSYSSSFNSSTGLLKNNNTKTSDYGSASASSDGVPKRKQVRVQDPYAHMLAGLSDDEDEEGDDTLEALDLHTARRPAQREESLADFLRNVPPPPSSPPQPFITPMTPIKAISKKSSSGSLISRLGRRKNSISSPGGHTREASLSGPPEPYARARPNMSIRTDVDQFRDIGSPRTRILGQARSARTARNDTEGLAEFLKHTGPPPETPGRRKEGGEKRALLGKMSFSGRKKGLIA
ncbi:hypothetical protein BZA77DRAFT_352834 [Pyronema omphalodes]|nr:hypothetical protein BZA77DRAFT_352834 [Pyronema omphalodes]